MPYPGPVSDPHEVRKGLRGSDAMHAWRCAILPTSRPDNGPARRACAGLMSHLVGLSHDHAKASARLSEMRRSLVALGEDDRVVRWGTQVRV